MKRSGFLFLLIMFSGCAFLGLGGQDGYIEPDFPDANNPEAFKEKIDYRSYEDDFAKDVVQSEDDVEDDVVTFKAQNIKSEGFNIVDYDAVVINTDYNLGIDVGGEDQEEDEDIDLDEFKQILKAAAIDKFRQTNLFDFVVDSPKKLRGLEVDNILICKIVIKDIVLGNNFTRFLLSSMGGGYYLVEIEAKLVDNNTNERMLLFRDSRTGIDLSDYNPDQEQEYIKDDLKNLVIALVDDVKK